ncbi:TonB-linked outer membrane protein, SusC/RagA family [Aquiflexum balticum DSM 16537]|uniref:TonB-linked outer membrane protein, SusC/RagA family n=1 Tax=Aquiflexum balticum DSM 16537 TaxID=758820 RepID=A0A1W2HA42_9BACT|nr:SusC/RagA family TonB-linked outer membrane protein [Aquiflexum balticum]SMD45568.1 TonB-linked outer membrane protein, SusC/RagA family [Aquiflexum balticum DSM 16537]
MKHFTKLISMLATVGLIGAGPTISVWAANSGPNESGSNSLISESFARDFDRTIGGVVTSADDGFPMPGVSILLKGTTRGTATDIDGAFSITVPDEGAVLVFSFIGFKTQEVAVTNASVINLSMELDLTAMQEVVVVGYGTMRKGDITSAVAQVKPEEFITGAVRNAGELLRGKVAGLAISTPTGDPAAGPEISLRGITSVFGSSEPLVLIDGYPGSLNVISPMDIESVEVLKDASAAAIYGARGKNGVILITTKQGKSGKPTVEYSNFMSTSNFVRTADFMSASDMRGFIDQGLIDSSNDLGGDTDWLGEITRDIPFNHFHNVSLRGGTEQTKYVANMSYQNELGAFYGSGNEEFKFRMDLTQFFVNNKVKVNMNVLRGIQNIDARFNGWTYRQALIRNPTDRVFNDDGRYQERPEQFQYENPLALINEQDYKNVNDWTWLTGSASYFPVPELELKVVGSQHRTKNDFGSYQGRNHISTIRDNRNGVANVSNSQTVENFLDLTADYQKIIGDHRVHGMIGYSYIDWTNTGMAISNFNFPSDVFSFRNIQQGTALREGLPGTFANSSFSDWKLIGFFARAGYGFKDKYNFLGSLRYEGSSRFGTNQKWGLFPAISAGWTISNEGFLKSSSTVDFLKFRVGYGETGSVSTNPYESLTRYAYSPTQFYFDGQNWVSVLNPVANPNPNLGWETNIEYNIGFDFNLWKNKLSGSIDYYDRTLQNLVYSYPVPVPPNLVGTTLANAAAMRNSGMEVTFNSDLIRKDKIEWKANVNFSMNTNELTSLSSEEFQLRNNFFFTGGTGDPIQLSTHKVEEGQPIGSFFGFKSVGVVNDSSDPTRNGTWLIEGQDGEVKSILDANPDDRQILGNGMPRYFLNFNNYIRIDKFDINVTMRGAFDYQILNFQRMFYENPGIVYNRLNSSFDPIDGQILRSPQSYVSHYIENGDFWKIDNVSVGYNFPTETSKFFTSARVYVAGSNLFTFTNYQGLDPEVPRSGLAPGNDGRDKFPTLRIFTIGTDLRF